VNQPHHEIHSYIPATALDTIADDCGARRIDDLNYAPGRAIKDSVMANLSKAMLGALESGEEPCRLFVDHLLSAVATHLAISAGGLEPRSRPAIGCLSAAQERRAKEVLSANLGGDLELADLARECGLSMGYFGRAFRRSTGMAPHQWLVRRRVQIAKRHLGETALPLAEVALESGFVDQSHFTRVFTQHVGTSPGRWRAARRADASEEGV
jgi:AraC-like DNA-binding protein